MSDAVANEPTQMDILDAFREPLWENDSRFTVLQGGGGSGKSHAICQYLCYLFMTYDDIIIAVVRESMPILKKTVYMGDPSIVRMLREWNVPVDDWWNKTDTTITNPCNKSEFRFIGLDSSEKIKSQNWNYCWKTLSGPWVRIFRFLPAQPVLNCSKPWTMSCPT